MPSATQFTRAFGRTGKLGWYRVPTPTVGYDTKYFELKQPDIRGSRNATAGNFADVLQVLESGRYLVSETITRTVSFRAAGEALTGWAAEPAKVTKIHFEP
jgi:threonine dehydrogenase-like Zn-dependent dehydrogenase